MPRLIMIIPAIKSDQASTAIRVAWQQSLAGKRQGSRHRSDSDSSICCYMHHLNLSTKAQKLREELVLLTPAAVLLLAVGSCADQWEEDGGNPNLCPELLALIQDKIRVIPTIINGKYYSVSSYFLSYISLKTTYMV